jgi:hypothetical protein
MSRVRLTALITACVAASALSTYECLEVRRSGGRFDAAIRIRSDRPAAIRSVTWKTCFRQRDAQNAVALCMAGGSLDFGNHVLRPTEGVVEIEGRTGARQSPFRILRNEWAYERFVILKIEFEDGTTVYRWAEVSPQDRASVTVVHLPADEPDGVGGPP